MPLHPELSDICWRIVLTLLAGFLIGLDRTERGKPAGIRTTMLVCVAASLSMILVNLLLYSPGKSSDSFNTLDLMRLPLGILSGMGFIGAGTIIRRGNLIVGVTTAATLWFTTMIGICLGAGQLAIGMAGLLLGLGILWLIRKLEDRLKQMHRATLLLLLTVTAPAEQEIRLTVTDADFRIERWEVGYSRAHRRIRCLVNWWARPTDTRVPDFIEKLRGTAGVESVRWVPDSGNK